MGKVGICVKYTKNNIYKIECVRTKFFKDQRFNINWYLISKTMDNNVFECQILQTVKDICQQNR